MSYSSTYSSFGVFSNGEIAFRPLFVVIFKIVNLACNSRQQDAKSLGMQTAHGQRKFKNKVIRDINSYNPVFFKKIFYDKYLKKTFNLSTFKVNFRRKY